MCCWRGGLLQSAHLGSAAAPQRRSAAAPQRRSAAAPVSSDGPAGLRALGRRAPAAQTSMHGCEATVSACQGLSVRTLPTLSTLPTLHTLRTLPTHPGTQLEPDLFDGTRVRAAERMGAHGACEAHRRLAALGGPHRMHAAVAHFDCGARAIRAWPRPTQTPTLQRQRPHELARELRALRGAPPSRRRAVERAARRFQLNGEAARPYARPSRQWQC